MDLVFFGTPQFAVPSLKALLSHPGFQVKAVVTQPDKRRGRGNQLIPSPIKQVALEYQVPVWDPRRVKKDEETLDNLRSTQADAFVVVAYGQILSQEILEMPRLGCVNAHGSILPQYRGAAPIQWSLYHGEAETGITTMRMDAGMDTGPMLLEARTKIDLLDNFETLAGRLARMSADLLVATLHQLEAGTIQPMPQDNDRATYAPLIKKEDYELDWSRSAIALHNQVRGFAPNGTTLFRGEPLKVLATAPLGSAYWQDLPTEIGAVAEPWATLAESAAQPGEVVFLAKNVGLVVQTGDGLLLLREVQPSGKRSQSGWDFVNGSRLQIGEKLGRVDTNPPKQSHD